MRDENEKMNLFIYMISIMEFEKIPKWKKKTFNFFSNYENLQINACAIVNMWQLNNEADESYY